jgi:hypothetical protein
LAKGEYFQAIAFGYLALELFIQGKLDDGYQNAKKGDGFIRITGRTKRQRDGTTTY